MRWCAWHHQPRSKLGRCLRCGWTRAGHARLLWRAPIRRRGRLRDSILTARKTHHGISNRMNTEVGRIRPSDGMQVSSFGSSCASRANSSCSGHGVFLVRAMERDSQLQLQLQLQAMQGRPPCIKEIGGKLEARQTSNGLAAPRHTTNAMGTSLIREVQKKRRVWQLQLDCMSVYCRLMLVLSDLNLKLTYLGSFALHYLGSFALQKLLPSVLVSFLAAGYLLAA